MRLMRIPDDSKTLGCSLLIFSLHDAYYTQIKHIYAVYACVLIIPILNE